MQLIDDQIAKLEKINVEATKRADFDLFWDETVHKARTLPLGVEGEAVVYPFPWVQVRDLTVAGVDGTRVRTWLLLPPQAKEGPVPAVVTYHGAGGSRGTPASHAQWLSMGMAVIAMDFRMQGGLTGSLTGFTGSSNPCWFALGVGKREDFYFYQVWTDALRMIELALATPEIDKKQIMVDGGSQGGAASLAMAALHPAVALCCADVPSNCWFEKRLFDRAGGANGLAWHLAAHPHLIDKTVETLSYFDNINLVDRITCPVLVSTGLKDPVCPPDTVYAAFNRIAAPKEIVAYPFGEHGGGAMVHTDAKLAFVHKHFLE